MPVCVGLIMLTAYFCHSCYKINEAPIEFQNWPRPLFRPRTDHACSQKPNPYHETVPLNIKKISQAKS